MSRKALEYNLLKKSYCLAKLSNKDYCEKYLEHSKHVILNIALAHCHCGEKGRKAKCVWSAGYFMGEELKLRTTYYLRSVFLSTHGCCCCPSRGSCVLSGGTLDMS